MKAISVKQPWAQLICLGIKPIENRTWATKFRGRTYIHASGKPAGPELQTILNYDQAKAVPEENWYEMLHGIWQLSSIIGEVDIVDCVLGHNSIWAEHSAIVMRKIKGVSQEIEVPVYNWVLENAVLYEKPILGVKGALSFWDFNKEEQ
jgi:hypothetical protein